MCVSLLLCIASNFGSTEMAVNLLLRRSTARLLCPFRSQVASFFTERPRPSEPPSTGPLIRRKVHVDYDEILKCFYGKIPRAAFLKMEEDTKLYLCSLAEQAEEASTPVSRSHSDEDHSTYWKKYNFLGVDDNGDEFLEVLYVHEPTAAVSRMHSDIDHIKLKQYWKKYNILRDGHNSDEVLDGDKEWQNLYLPTEREMAKAHIDDYREILKSFCKRFLPISFKEHLVKHCSHRKIQWDALLNFQEALKLYPCNLAEEAEHYYNQNVEFRDKKKLPKGHRATLLKEVEKSKEELREEYRITDENMKQIEQVRYITDEVMKEIEQDRYITDEVMKEIEQDITKKINEDLVKNQKRKVKKKVVNEEEMVARGMATPR